jgi:hypothetical protein
MKMKPQFGLALESLRSYYKTDVWILGSFTFCSLIIYLGSYFWLYFLLHAHASHKFYGTAELLLKTHLLIGGQLEVYLFIFISCVLFSLEFVGFVFRVVVGGLFFSTKEEIRLRIEITKASLRVTKHQEIIKTLMIPWGITLVLMSIGVLAGLAERVGIWRYVSLGIMGYILMGVPIYWAKETKYTNLILKSTSQNFKEKHFKYDALFFSFGLLEFVVILWTSKWVAVKYFVPLTETYSNTLLNMVLTIPKDRVRAGQIDDLMRICHEIKSSIPALLEGFQEVFSVLPIFLIVGFIFVLIPYINFASKKTRRWILNPTTVSLAIATLTKLLFEKQFTLYQKFPVGSFLVSWLFGYILTSVYRRVIFGPYPK